MIQNYVPYKEDLVGLHRIIQCFNKTKMIKKKYAAELTPGCG